MRKCKKLFLVVLMLSVSLLFLVARHYKKKTTSSEAAKRLSSVVSSDLSARDYCKKYPEWEQVGENTFLRPSAAYYFIDRHLVKLFLVQRSHLRRNQVLYLEIFEKKSSKTLKSIVLRNGKLTGHFDHYPLFMCSFNAHFNLDNHVNRSQIDSLELRVFMRSANLSNKKPIILKVKSMTGPNLSTHKFASKKLAIMCAKPSVYDASQIRSLEWWFKLNQKIGYSKMVINNNSITGSTAFERLFTKYRFVYRYGKDYGRGSRLGWS